MKSKYNKPLLLIAVGSLLVAIIWDGFLGGSGLGTVVGCLALIVSIIVATILSAISDRKRASAPPVQRPASTTPVFAHVPGPGESGYDPDYDPDDDKYWRRYY